MVDKISSDHRSKNMQRIKSKDTKPEITVRKLVYKLGYRYRLHRRDLPGKPDIVLPGSRKVIFVHGCFWHQHTKKKCSDARLPKSNTEYWILKLDRNRTRDAGHVKELKKLGWQLLIIWDCDLKNINKVEKKLENFLKR